LTVDYLRFHALAQPQAIALIQDGREIRYAEFACDLWKFTRAVRRFQLPRGSSVAIGCDDFYTHWLLILAFERLGIATASFGSTEGSASRDLLGSVDLVLAEPHFPTGGWNTRALTEAWRQAVLAAPDEGPVPGAVEHPDDVVRILRTSGTTGTPKRFPLRRRMSQARQVRRQWLYRGWPEGARVLVSFAWSVGDTYGSVEAALRAGQTVVAQHRLAVADMPALIRTHKLPLLSVLPVQLKQLLELLPDDWVKPDRLEIRSFGGAIPEALRRAVLERLATRVTEVYGANEFGLAAVTREADSGGFGILLPEVEVEIVDEADRPVPDGTAGQIRVRGPSVFDGYLGDPTLTRRMLRQGWFYPGDTGIRDGGRLQVLGRSDDQVNIGGAKYPLTRLEEHIQKIGGPGLRDAGLIAIADAAGIAELHVALVTDGSDDRALLDRIIAVLQPIVAGNLNVIRLEQIPRNEMGKIDRIRLKQAIVEIRAR
jgi:2,3-dihydroxybenzoate-AMP ligase